jgi:uncharacterized protein YjiS (DUF1127 family)
MLAASFTASSPIVRPSRVELLDADSAFQIDSGFSLVTWLREIRDRVALRLQRRAAIAELHALSDATLADIGIPRHMIVSLVNERFQQQSAATQPSAVKATRHRTWRAPAGLGEASNAQRFDNAA